MNKPLVSIVITYYNKKDTILRSVNSVLNQTYQNWELMIIDDCGIDKLDKNKFPEDSRLTFLFNSSNLGAAKTRQRGLDLSNGEFIAFLDADDWWDINFLECCVNGLLVNLNFDGAYVKTKILKSGGDFEIRRHSDLNLTKIRETIIQFGRPWQTSSILWRKSSCGNWGILKTSEDSWFEIKSSKHNQLLEINDIFNCYDGTGNNHLSIFAGLKSSTIDQQELFFMIFKDFWAHLNIKYKIILYHRLVRGHLKIHVYCPDQAKVMGDRLFKLSPWLFIFRNRAVLMKVIHILLRNSPFKIYY